MLFHMYLVELRVAANGSVIKCENAYAAHEDIKGYKVNLLMRSKHSSILSLFMLRTRLFKSLKVQAGIIHTTNLGER